MNNALSYKFIRTKKQQYVPIPDNVTESVQLIDHDRDVNSSIRNNNFDIYDDCTAAVAAVRNSSESASATNTVSYFNHPFNGTYITSLAFFCRNSQISNNVSVSNYSNELPNTLPVTLADYDFRQQSSNRVSGDEDGDEEESSYEHLVCSCCESSTSSCGHFVETNKSRLKFFSQVSGGLSCLVLLGLLLQVTYNHYFAFLLRTSLSKQVCD